VTRDIAGSLARLAAAFEDRGHPPEQVARFLMRCVFCFFAEDVGLLPHGLFRRTLESARTAGGPARVAEVLTRLWQTMDTGGDFGAEMIDRFNGHFFQSVESLPLEAADVQLLVEAAGFDWSAVEPSIFGTLLVRALDPVERHKLGAEYTPREYIERLVEPTVLEPLRARWAAVQARVTQLEEEDAAAAASRTPRKLSKQRREALDEVTGFHAWLRGLRFLDPACGSGNFLYVTMAVVKELELEVIREIERLGAREGVEQTEQILDEVHPRQFHGIEVSWWAREIAELTLWIGYHQFWRREHGGRTPPIPILEDTGTIECRDAILAWDEIVHRPEKDRPDPTPRIVHPVTGELVPDPEAKLKYMEYVGARQAEWPKADFIVGNPPYLGKGKQRNALGDGYVKALRATYPLLSEGVDLVMYWWARAARLVSDGETIRSGLITTNSLRQSINGQAISQLDPLRATVIWACPDHPWVEEADGAAVRVALTVVGEPRSFATLATIDPRTDAVRMRTVARLGPTLGTVADLGGAVEQPLVSNKGLAAFGFLLAGRGFVVQGSEVSKLSKHEPEVIKTLIGGKDVVNRPRDRSVIDFGTMELEEARAYPLAFTVVTDRVKPSRDANNDPGRKQFWWRFGRTNEALREALESLPRYFATVETAKHRFFIVVSGATAAEHGVLCIALSESFHLGIISSGIHTAWSLGVGATLEDRPRYTKTHCFDPFPFPDPTPELRDKIGALAERLDQHRRDAIARDESVTMTGMYNVVEKLRSGEALTPKERKVHEIAACGVLRDMHDELDTLVAAAYGWPWPMEREEILERLVALHGERVEEEKKGHVRWLRPEYQIPRFAPDQAPAELDLPEEDEADSVPALKEKLPWPNTAVEQLEAITGLAARGVTSVRGLVAGFDGADKKLVARHLETLVMLGEVGG
jgi:hypothetical protein